MAVWLIFKRLLNNLFTHEAVCGFHIHRIKLFLVPNILSILSLKWKIRFMKVHGLYLEETKMNHKKRLLSGSIPSGHLAIRWWGSFCLCGRPSVKMMLGTLGLGFLLETCTYDPHQESPMTELLLIRLPAVVFWQQSFFSEKMETKSQEKAERTEGTSMKALFCWRLHDAETGFWFGTACAAWRSTGNSKSRII